MFPLNSCEFPSPPYVSSFWMGVSPPPSLYVRPLECVFPEVCPPPFHAHLSPSSSLRLKCQEEVGGRTNCKIHPTLFFNSFPFCPYLTFPLSSESWLEDLEVGIWRLKFRPRDSLRFSYQDQTWIKFNKFSTLKLLAPKVLWMDWGYPPPPDLNFWASQQAEILHAYFVNIKFKDIWVAFKRFYPNIKSFDSTKRINPNISWFLGLRVYPLF